MIMEIIDQIKSDYNKACSSAFKYNSENIEGRRLTRHFIFSLCTSLCLAAKHLGFGLISSQ